MRQACMIPGEAGDGHNMNLDIANPWLLLSNFIPLHSGSTSNSCKHVADIYQFQVSPNSLWPNLYDCNYRILSLSYETINE